jgi:hypothetical protein
MFSNGNGNAITPRLEPKQLYEKRIARDKSKLKSYNQILSQIHNRIYHTSQLSGNTNYLVYTVPPFVLGLPSIDLQDCIVYIVHQLRQSGFVVRYTYPNLLYISWKHYETEYNRQQNPIVQAMMPASTSKKGKDGKRGMESAPPPISFGSSSQAPARSTTDYQPPDSFLQGITRPATAPIGNGVPKAPERDVLADLWKFA